jgi:hypothetical protein
MAHKRKTIEVAELKARINHMLAHGVNNPEGRKALGSLLSMVLMDTGNYKGFNYLDWLNGGAEHWRNDGEPKDTTPYLGDQSRVEYY